MRFAFIGYDVFLEAPQALLAAGWQLIYAQVFETDNKYNFNTQLEALAESLGIPHNFGKLDAANTTQLLSTKPDIILVGGYGYKIDVASLGDIPCINIHPSPLPEGRGPWPFPHYILQGKNEGAVTWHVVADKWDSGAIVLQAPFPVDPALDNIETLYAKAQLVNQILAAQFAGDARKLIANARPQTGPGSYWHMPKWPEGQSFNFTMTVAEIDRIHRAFGKFCCGVHFDNQDWLVRDLRTWQQPHTFTPGTCVTTYGHDKTFAAKDGFVYLRGYEKDE